MTRARRELVAGSLALLAGCTRLTSSDDAANTTNPPEDYSLPDLRIYNERDRAAAVTVRWIPEDQEEPTMELLVRVPSDDVLVWNENPLLGEPGRMTAAADDGSGDPRWDERDWSGDTDADNCGLVVFVEPVGIRVAERVA